MYSAVLLSLIVPTCHQHSWILKLWGAGEGGCCPVVGSHNFLTAHSLEWILGLFPSCFQRASNRALCAFISNSCKNMSLFDLSDCYLSLAWSLVLDCYSDDVSKRSTPASYLDFICISVIIHLLKEQSKRESKREYSIFPLTSCQNSPISLWHLGRLCLPECQDPSNKLSILACWHPVISQQSSSHFSAVISTSSVSSCSSAEQHAIQHVSCNAEV